jgi:hypothetical protein
MADAITAVLQFAPGVVKLAQEIVAASDKVKSNAQLIQFQTALIGLNSLLASVQQENATLAAQKRDAEEELKRVKHWESEKQRYKLAAPFAGCMVYALQKSTSDGETPHYLCASCFKQGKPSILQGVEGGPKKEGGRLFGHYLCPICKSAAFTGYINAPAPEYFEDIEPKT